MIKNDNNVCALVVTYNRKEYLIKLLNALLNQSYPISKILIFDNNSNDGTSQYLSEKKFIDTYNFLKLNQKKVKNIEILYFRNNENLGGSGGFNKGIALAHDLKCKYIWTMDDDVLPDNECLEILMKNLSNSRRMCIPNRSDENFKDYAIVGLNMSNPLKYNTKSRKYKISAEKLEKEVVEVKDMPFEGPIFESSLVDEVGLPKEDLFIIFDDTEFAYRVQKVTKIGFVKNAILHKQIIPRKDSKRLMNWKDYYGYRNQYWFDRTYGKNVFVKKLRPIFNHIDMMLRAIVKRKWSNIEILKAAYYDGTHNILGKTVEPGKEFKRNK